MHAELRQEKSTLVALQRLEALEAQRRAEDQARIAQHEQTASILLEARNRNTRLFGLATGSSVLFAVALVVIGWQHQQHVGQVATILDGFSRKRTALEKEHAAAMAEMQRALKAAEAQVVAPPAAVAPPAPVAEPARSEERRPTAQAALQRPVAASERSDGVKRPTISLDPLFGVDEESEQEQKQKRKPAPSHRPHRRDRR